jgi:hypothetical protein
MDAAVIAHTAGALPAKDLALIRRWFGDFARWMQESDVGQEEAASYNNHGMFYDAQLAAFLRFAGDAPKARRVVFNAATLRILGQIDHEGMLPHELQRTRPFHYTAFSLLAATHLAHHAIALDEAAPTDAKNARCAYRKIECPLDYYRMSEDGRSLKKAVTKLAETVVDPKRWTRTTKVEPVPPLFRTVPVLLMASQHMQDETLSAAIKALREHGGNVADDPSWLMWPPK